MMNNFTEKDRIEQFSKLMDSYVPEDFKKWLHGLSKHSNIQTKEIQITVSK